MTKSVLSIFVCLVLFSNLVKCEVPQLIDYIFVGRYLDCYECHSNRPGCGADLDWILMRWKRCDMPSPKCVKIYEKIGSQEFLVRGCLKEIEVARANEIPTVRMNGCWTVDGEYIGWGRNLFIPTDKTVYCFCDERDGCNGSQKLKSFSLITFLLYFILKYLFL